MKKPSGENMNTENTKTNQTETKDETLGGEESVIQNFHDEIIRTTLFPDILSAIILFACISVTCLLSPMQILWSSLVAIPVLVISKLLFSPLVNRLISSEINERLITWQNGDMKSSGDRTALFEDLMAFPKIKAIETIIFILASHSFICISMHLIPAIGLSWISTAHAFLVGLFQCYMTAAIAYSKTMRICEGYAESLEVQGLDNRYIRKKKLFGMGMLLKTIFLILVPAVIANIIYCAILVQGNSEVNSMIPSFRQQLLRISFMVVTTIPTSLYVCFIYYRHIFESNEKLSSTMTKIFTEGEIGTRTKTAIDDKMQYNIYLLNGIVERFQRMFSTTSKIGMNIRETSNSLSVTAKELSSASLAQSASIKEILATMEDSNSLSQSISKNIDDVTSGVEGTVQDVSSSIDVLSEIIEQMKQIDSANKSIMSVMKQLGNQIENIGDVVAIINDIADQTRIIAFNAELEAVSAGDEGHNFHIVATEIRRLANSTMNSIHEINQYIQNIQTSFTNLIKSSETGTECIEEETVLAQELEAQFSVIKDLADVTSHKTNEISQIIEQQTQSFNQIVITVRQISSGIESFASLTQSISKAAMEMQSVTAKLSTLQKDSLNV